MYLSNNINFRAYLPENKLFLHYEDQLFDIV
jgi:hypothetical protein